MKIRLLVPSLLLVVGLSGCIPGIAHQRFVEAVFQFLLFPGSDTFGCFPQGDFTTAFDVTFTEDPENPPGRLELRQRGVGIVQLAIGNLRFAGAERFDFDLRGSGTHGDVAYSESYTGTLAERRMEGEYALTQEGCGTVRWSFEGDLERDLDIPAEGV